MECQDLVYSGHALQRMFERGLEEGDVEEVVRTGEEIATYPDDQPFPSRLLLGFVVGRPVHVVVARDDEAGCCYVITAYVPDASIWQDDFRTRR